MDNKINTDIKYANFGVGFTKYVNNSFVGFLDLNEKGELDIQNDITSQDFIIYVSEIVKDFTNKMKFMKSRKLDIEKIKALKLETIDVNTIALESVWQMIVMNNIGGMALLSIYNNDFYKEVLDFMLAEDGSIEPLLIAGSEARNGKSILVSYQEVIERVLVPLYGIDLVKDNI